MCSYSLDWKRWHDQSQLYIDLFQFKNSKYNFSINQIINSQQVVHIKSLQAAYMNLSPCRIKNAGCPIYQQPKPIQHQQSQIAVPSQQNLHQNSQRQPLGCTPHVNVNQGYALKQLSPNIAQNIQSGSNVGHLNSAKVFSNSNTNLSACNHLGHKYHLSNGVTNKQNSFTYLGTNPHIKFQQVNNNKIMNGSNNGQTNNQPLNGNFSRSSHYNENKAIVMPTKSKQISSTPIQNHNAVAFHNLDSNRSNKVQNDNITNFIAYPNCTTQSQTFVAQNSIIESANSHNMSVASNSSNSRTKRQSDCKLSKPPLSPKSYVSNSSAKKSNSVSKQSQSKSQVEFDSDIDALRVSGKGQSKTKNVNSNTYKYPNFLNKAKQRSNQAIENTEYMNREQNSDNKGRDDIQLGLQSKLQSKNTLCCCNKIATHRYLQNYLCPKCAINKMIQGFQVEPINSKQHNDASPSESQANKNNKDTQNRQEINSNNKFIMLTKIKNANLEQTQVQAKPNIESISLSIPVLNLQVCQSNLSYLSIPLSTSSKSSCQSSQNNQLNLIPISKNSERPSAQELLAKAEQEKAKLIELESETKRQVMMLGLSSKEVQLIRKSEREQIRNSYRTCKQMVKEHYEQIKNALKQSIQLDLKELQRLQSQQMDLLNVQAEKDRKRKSGTKQIQQYEKQMRRKQQCISEDIRKLTKIGAQLSKHRSIQGNQQQLQEQLQQICSKYSRNRNLCSLQSSFSLSGLSGLSQKSNQTTSNHAKVDLRSRIRARNGDMCTNKQLYGAQIYRFMKSNPNNNKMKINVINISNSDKISAQSYCTDNEAGNKDRQTISTSNRPTDLYCNQENYNQASLLEPTSNSSSYSNIGQNCQIISTKNTKKNVLFSFQDKA